MAKMTISVPDDWKEELMKIAYKESRSLSSLVRIAIQYYLENKK